MFVQDTLNSLSYEAASEQHAALDGVHHIETDGACPGYVGYFVSVPSCFLRPTIHVSDLVDLLAQIEPGALPSDLEKRKNELLFQAEKLGIVAVDQQPAVAAKAPPPPPPRPTTAPIRCAALQCDPNASCIPDEMGLTPPSVAAPTAFEERRSASFSSLDSLRADEEDQPQDWPAPANYFAGTCIVYICHAVTCFFTSDIETEGSVANLEYATVCGEADKVGLLFRQNKWRQTRWKAVICEFRLLIYNERKPTVPDLIIELRDAEIKPVPKKETRFTIKTATHKNATHEVSLSVASILLVQRLLYRCYWF